MADKEQQSLFDESAGTLWGEEWKDMPEFVQENIEPFKSVTVHFRSQQDLDAFAKLLDQYIPPSRSIWFPNEEYAQFHNKRWNDES